MATTTYRKFKNTFDKISDITRKFAEDTQKRAEEMIADVFYYPGKREKYLKDIETLAEIHDKMYEYTEHIIFDILWDFEIEGYENDDIIYIEDLLEEEIKEAREMIAEIKGLREQFYIY